MSFLKTLCCVAALAIAAPLSAQDGPKKPSKEDIDRIRKMLSGKADKPLTKADKPKEKAINTNKPKRKPGLQGARYGVPSPDNSQIAFALHGDIWTMPINGGRATRVTLNEANEIMPCWSNDGSKLLYSSDRSGSWDIYEMDALGGKPRRITFDGGSDLPLHYGPTGRRVLMQSSRSGTWRLHSIGLDGGFVKTLTLDDRVQGGEFHAESGYLYYTRIISDTKRKGYRGSANDELYRCKPGEKPERLTDNLQNDRSPQISNDGKTLYFRRETGEKGKDYNIFAMDLETLETRQITDLDNLGVGSFRLGADGKTAVISWKYRLYTLDLSADKPTPELAPVYVVEDTRQPKMIESTITSGAANADVSKDGKRIAFDLGGAIWTIGASGGKARRITEAGSGDTMPRWSPNGKQIAFSSTGRGDNQDLFLMNADGSNITKLTTNKGGDHFHNWSPDGQYLIYSADDPQGTGTRGRPQRNIWRIDVKTKKAVQMTSHSYPDDDPSYSPDGKWIAYDSHPTGNADLWIMRADGTDARKVYGNASQEESPRFSPNGQLLVFTRSTGPGQSSVVVTDLAGSGEITVGSGGGGQFSADGKEIIYTDTRGNIRAVRAPDSLTGGRSIPFIAERKDEQSKVFMTAFNEAWTHVNTNFYDMEYHDTDWAAMKKKYQPLIAGAKTKMEFYFFMTNMLGELNASHQGINGSISSAKPYATGRLGAKLTPEPMRMGPRGSRAPYLRLRVDSVDKGGPLNSKREGTWVREGDYIFGVGRTRFTTSTNIAKLLNNTTGKETTLLVGAEADGSDIRSVVIKPESDRAKRSRDYSQWVAKNKKAVSADSKGQVAYIHLPGMMPPNLARFQADLANRSVQRAKALVMDVRNNGGGNIHQQLIDILARKQYTYMFDKRNKKGRKTPSLVWQRPIVLLINERSFSDAEVFPHAFKQLELGTIVGVQTPGAVIGTVNTRLSDGSSFRITRTGFRNFDGKNQESNGCMPHVVVVETAEDRIDGNDPQLDKAIEIALSKIKGGKATSTKPGPETTAKPAEPDSSKNNKEAKPSWYVKANAIKQD